MKDLYIKNFRNIGEEGVSIKLSPITIFTGCNSAGKSTAAKALLMLESYLSDVKRNNYNLIGTPLDFSKVVKLGSFDTVLNAESKANGQGNIMLGYSFHSVILVADIQVRFIFEKRENDSLNNGWLNELAILIDSKPLLSILIKDNKYSLDITDKEKFIEYYRYYMIKQIASNWKSHNMRLKEESYMPSVLDYQLSIDELEKKIPQINELIKLDRELYKEGFIGPSLWNEDLDKDFSFFKEKENEEDKVKPIDVLCAIENILYLHELDFQIYRIEQLNNNKITSQDIPHIIERTYKTWLEDPICSSNSRCVNIINKSKDYIKSYIDSAWTNILDLKKTKNLSKIDSLMDSFNSLGETAIENGNLSAFDWIDFGNLSTMFCHNHIGSFLKYILGRVLNPDFCGKIGYVDASTVDVKRVYPLDFSDKFGNLWKKYHNLYQRSRPYVLTSPLFRKADIEDHGSFIRKWLREFGICDDLKIENSEGMLRIKLTSENNPDGRLLADFGYGVTQLIALLLNIEIAISNTEYKLLRYSGQPDNSDDYRKDIPYILILEEPEVHLHPSLQSRLADIFMDAEKKGVEFVIETHSEYLVRRTQVLVSEMKLDEKNIEWKNPFRVYYFPSKGLPYDMDYRIDGRFSQEFGSGFFDEASNLAICLF